MRNGFLRGIAQHRKAEAETDSAGHRYGLTSKQRPSWPARFRLLADNPALRGSGDLSGLSAFDAMLVGGASDFDWCTGSALAALGFPNEEAWAAIVHEVVGSLPLEEVWGVYYATTSKQVRWLLRTAIDRRELYRDDSHAARVAEEHVAAIADLEPFDLSELSDEDAAGL